MSWRNTRTGTVYDEVMPKLGSPSRMYARKATTLRWSLVRADHLEGIEDEHLWDPQDPTYEDDDELAAPEPPVIVPAPAVQPPRIPAIHAHLRTKSYSVGSAMELLAGMEPDWPVERTVETLKVAVLLLGDEVDRVQGVARG